MMVTRTQILGMLLGIVAWGAVTSFITISYTKALPVGSDCPSCMIYHP